MSVNQVNQTTGALSPIAGGTLYADAPVGSIQAYGGATAPFGWLLCQGQAVSRATYAELFGVIGTSFGAGDGSTTFNIPDLRDKFPEGASNTNTLGSAKSAGLPNITGNASLGYNDSSAIGVMTRSANGAFVTQKDGSTYWSGPAANIGTYDNSFHFDASRSNSIYGKSTTVQPPAVCVNFIIKATTIALPSDFEAAVDEKIADVTAIEYGVPAFALQNNYTFTNCRYTKSGHVCTAFIQFGVVEPSVSGELLCASDFPKAAQQGANAHFWIFRWDDFSVDPVGGYINQNGNLYLKGGIVGGTMPYAVAFTYITTD